MSVAPTTWSGKMAEDEPSAKRRARGPRAIAAILPAVTGGVRAKRGLAPPELIADWPRIVGAELAAHCVPRKLARGRGEDGGTLHIRVAGGFALELQHRAPQVIERINSYFGYRAVARLALKQGLSRHMRAAPPPALPPSALTPKERATIRARHAGVTDDGLREALARLAESIAKHARRRTTR